MKQQYGPGHSRGSAGGKPPAAAQGALIASTAIGIEAAIAGG